MCKFFCFLVSFFCAANIAFAQKSVSLALSDKMVAAIKQSMPDWTIVQPPEINGSGINNRPMFEMKISNGQKRRVNISVDLINESNLVEDRFRSFFIRSIMPPDNGKIENHVTKGFFVGTGDSVEAIFSKANLMVNIDLYFQPSKKTRRIPKYTLPAPNGEKEELFKIVEIIAKTIEEDANLNNCSNNFFRYTTPPNAPPEIKFLNAVKGGNPEQVSEILQQKVDPNARLTQSLETALHFAARQGCVETISVLIAAKADVNTVNERGETPLMFAASHNNLEAARLLIAANADIQAESFGRNAAFFALRARQTISVFNSRADRRLEKITKTIRSLLNDLAAKGLDLKKKDSRNGNTLLTELLSSARGKFAHDLTETLLEYGIDPNEANGSGNTPLLILANAPSDNCAQLMKLLIANGADVTKPDQNNQTALQILLKKQIEFKSQEDTSKIINEAIAVMVNAGAKE